MLFLGPFDTEGYSKKPIGKDMDEVIDRIPTR
jgi:hypothetical protein